MSVSKRGAAAPRDLTVVGDRVSFVYLERCMIHRDHNAITAEDADGIRHIPSATIGTLLLGPGTRVTHQAMTVLGESGAGVVWVGEHGVRYYSGGRALTRSSVLAEAQVTAWANRRTRLEVARAMYRMRFPDEDPAVFTRREILGREGARVKECYRAESARTGVPWRGRQYVPGDFNAGDAPNQGVTAAAQGLYGVAQAVVAALGCSPALGFVHSGHDLSFVMDIADLYKTAIGIPVAFDVAAQSEDDVGTRTRRAIRDRINDQDLLERCVRDIKSLLLTEEQPDLVDDTTERVRLRTDDGPDLESGRNYGMSAVPGAPWEVMW